MVVDYYSCRDLKEGAEESEPESGRPGDEQDESDPEEPSSMNGEDQPQGQGRPSGQQSLIYAIHLIESHLSAAQSHRDAAVYLMSTHSLLNKVLQSTLLTAYLQIYPTLPLGRRRVYLASNQPPLLTAEDPGCAGEMEEEAAALEAEFEAARAGASAGDLAAAGRDRAARECAKGVAVRNQRALWERMLELRILLQGCLQVSCCSG